ncbi:hypothetical protein MMU07_07295 [Aquiflexum sp. LQ15W]|uniref:hypothetical protein n=1 Tax=Cognataquiflexum nitidum TaxID=2922272 RepID=UPI001F12962B|nr:hypothetical protein [Cognataquiflexum nitidum]MCH6199376.1 hypothetical protein [Cognataquiflexum nitidum]
MAKPFQPDYFFDPTAIAGGNTLQAGNQNQGQASTEFHSEFLIKNFPFTVIDFPLRIHCMYLH